MRILIENLMFETIIGILDFERITPQQVVIDAVIDYTYHQENFINYAEVVEQLESTMQKERFELVETALEHLAQMLKQNFPLIQSLTLTIRKPQILPNCTVGVQKNFIF